MEEELADHQHHDHQEEEVIGCKEQHSISNNIIIKGKRTKRLRPQSPIPFAIPTNSSTVDGGGGGECNNTTNSSPTTSAELQDSTEEEEDMANCLILLAQGQSRSLFSSPRLLNQSPNDHNTTMTSRRFLEATPISAAVGPAKVAGAGAATGGYYVYECKTCNRTFPSFQALGGHRASHKKPKAAINVDDKKHFGIGLLPSDEEDTQLFKNMNINTTNTNTSSSSPLSLHLSNRGLILSTNNKKSKVHECSICGAEFTSGQALGGHMRRHRAPVGGPAANTTLSLTVPPPTVPLALEAQQPQHHHHHNQQQTIKKQRSMLSLDLDLNLPAPEDDHHHRDQSKFVFASKQQQQQQPQQPQQQQQQERLRILVDCHY